MSREFEVCEASVLVDLLVDHIPAYVFIKDADYRIVAANREFFTLYPEHMRDEIIGTTTVEQFDEEQRAQFLEHDRIALTEGFSETTEAIDMPNGGRHTLLTRKVGIDGSDGKRYLVGIAMDISELEAAKDRAHELGQLIACSQNEIFVVDVDTLRFIDANQGALTNLQFTTAELVERAVPDIVSDKSIEELQESLEPLLKSESDKVVIECCHRRKDGTEYACEVHVRLGESRGRRVFVAVAMDVTELVAQRSDLARKNAELREFAYRTSHDLRAPVVSAQSLIDIGREMLAQGDVESASECFAKARDVLGRIGCLADDVASLVRLEQVDSVATAVDAEAVIRDALDRLRSFAELEGVAIECDLRCPSVILTDVDVLRRAVENLVSNAVKYRDPRKDQCRVLVRAHEGENEAFVFECRDNGLGVPERNRDEIFSMFRRFHADVAFGSGLGLHTMKTGIEKLGGRVEYEPLGDGSCFRVVLPQAVQKVMT